MRTLVSCSDGWLVESNDGINVIAGTLVRIDSDFDWEMRHRRIYRPIKKP